MKETVKNLKNFKQSSGVVGGKIIEINNVGDCKVGLDGIAAILKLEETNDIPVTLEYLNECQPKVGGYYVEIENDGEETMKTYFEGDMFEMMYGSQKNVPCTKLNFQTAIGKVNKGQRLRRSGWGNEYAYVFLDNEIPGIVPSIVRNNGDHCTVWSPNQVDMLSEDWVVVPNY